jgi:hypothetical protein
MSFIFYSATSPPLGVVKCAGKYEVHCHSFLDFLIKCGIPQDTPEFPLIYNQLFSSDGVFYFNPYSSFGRAVLKLPPESRLRLINACWNQGTLFLWSFTQRRIKPLLKPKKRAHTVIPTPVINFIPPLYLPPPVPIPQHFYSPYLILITVLFAHFLRSVGPSVGPPRQGIG